MSVPEILKESPDSMPAALVLRSFPGPEVSGFIFAKKETGSLAPGVMVWEPGLPQISISFATGISFRNSKVTGSIIMFLLVKVYLFPLLETETPLPFTVSRLMFRLLVSVTVRV